MKRLWIGLGLALAMAGRGGAQLDFIYLDADDGGRHAVVAAGIESGGDGEELVVRIRSYGSGVESEGGWQAREGFNAHTARELASVLRVDGFEARLRMADGTTRRAEVAWDKTMRAFPRRALREDGSIDYFAQSGPLVGELMLRTVGGLEGTTGLELLARGEPRLLLEYEAASGRVTGVRMPGHTRAIPVAALEAEVEKERPLPLPAGWGEMKNDRKWQFVEEAVGEDEVKRARLVAALAGAKDWFFLEQVALYSHGAFDTDSIGVILQRAQAPNWRRTVAWFGAVSSGHSGNHSLSLLAEEGEKGKSLGWMNKHLDRLDQNLKVIKAQWEANGVVPVEPDGDRPPWIEDEVFGGMARAFEVEARPLGQEDLGQVTRAIRGWAVSQRWGSPWAQKVVELIEDRDWRVAEAACLAYTHGDTSAVPMDKFWKVAQDEKRDPRLREAAFLAWTYGNWGRVFVEIHDVAADPAHVFWMPAVSRLGELGNGWSLELLDELEKRSRTRLDARAVRLEPEQMKLLRQEREVLRERFARGDISHDFETTAWAIALGFDRSGDMEEWMLDRYGVVQFDTKASRTALAGPRGWRGGALAPDMMKARLDVRNRLKEELEFRWAKAREGEGGKEPPR